MVHYEGLNRKFWIIKIIMNQNVVKEILIYNKNTGIFRWRKSVPQRRKNSVAGCRAKDGYIHIKIKYKTYKAHRLAWLYCYGEFPVKHIDHINGDKSDNRLSNLRQCNFRENYQNKLCHRNGKSVGTIKTKNNKWSSRIKIGKKYKWLGTFDTEYEAYMKYKEVEKGLIESFGLSKNK